MKICRVCLQSDILCGACGKKLERGEISGIDVELSRALHSVNKEKGTCVDFLQSFEDSGRIFVVAESRHVAKFIGPGGRTIKKISNNLGRQIKLLEKAEGSDKHVIEKMIGAPVLGINKTYSKEQSSLRTQRQTSLLYPQESYKVRVEERYKRMVQPLSGVIGKILNKKITFVFE